MLNTVKSDLAATKQQLEQAIGTYVKFLNIFLRCTSIVSLGVCPLDELRKSRRPKKQTYESIYKLSIENC